MPTSTLSTLGAVGEEVELYTHFHLREDNATLYGFATAEELALFQTVTAVSGVGPKLALAMLSAMSAEKLAMAIGSGSTELLAEVPGVGKKVAERMVAELKDRAPEYTSADPAVVRLQADLAEQRAPRAIADAVSALVNLGYAQVQASAAVAAAARAAGGAASAEQLIRAGLKELAR